jgi:hypothetical protein
MQWSSSVDEQGQLHKTVHQGVSILAARVIPDHVLVAPWTDTRLTLLQLLRQGLRFLRSDHVLIISAKALFEGMASAIRQRNEKALLVLLELHFAVMKLHPGQDQEYFDRSTLPPSGRHLVGPFAHPLPLELFHLACGQPQTNRRTDTNTNTQTDDDEEYITTRLQEDLQNHQQDSDRGRGSTARILSLLIREGLDSIPADDPVLTRWAIHATQSRCRHNRTQSSSSMSSPHDDDEAALARWVLSHMAGTNDYGFGLAGPAHRTERGRGETGTLFVNGMLSWRRRDAVYPCLSNPSLFPELTFTDEVGYVYEGASAGELRGLDGELVGGHAVS